MSITGLPGNIPHQGLKERNPPDLSISRVRSPTTSDNGPQFKIGDIWANTLDKSFYVLLSKEKGIAIWVMGGRVTPEILTINNISPDEEGNFTISAGESITVTPGTNSITISVDD